jgi:hypothetical protein
LLLLTAAAGAQDVFIPDNEKNIRIEEIKKLAADLLAAKKDGNRIDATARAKIRKDMVAKDTIMKNERPAANGFSVPAFKWLYTEGQRLNDTNARLQAVIGLEGVDHATAVAALVDGLDDPDPAIQLRVLGAVKRKAIQRAWSRVMPKLASPNRVVVAAAAEALAKLGENPDKQVSDLMLKTLSDAFDKLKSTPETDAEERQNLEQLVEVLGRSYAELTASQWPETTSKLEDIEDAINKFKAARNQAFLGSLRDPVPKERLQALGRLRETPDKSVFFPVLEASVREFQNLQTAGTPDEKAPSLAFLSDASQLLSGLSGVPEKITPDSPTPDIEKAIFAWQQWYKTHMNR